MQASQSFRASYRLIVFVLSALFVLAFLSSCVYAQGGNTTPETGPVYPGVTPAKPLFDLPLVAPGVWPNGLITQSGTCQVPIRPMRNCTYFKLVYANSTNTEPSTSAPNAISIRASLIVLRSGQPASIRQVTFNGGNVEATLDRETMIVSDKIPEYWNVAENAKAYVRTYIRMPSSTAKIPCFTYISPLTGEAAKWVSSTTNPQDVTMAAWPTAAFTSAPNNEQPYYPVAVIGDADPTLPSVAFIGSSSSASLDGFCAQGLNALNIPYIILSTGGWTVSRYDVANLRSQIDASCTHIIEQYGRNDLGETYNPNTAVTQVLNPLKARMTHLWQRHKMQGAWISQVTIQPRIYSQGSAYPQTSYTDPYSQTPYPVEQPLRQPLNDWIRAQVSSPDGLLDFVYEMADMVEYIDNGVRTNRWKPGVSSTGALVSLTPDGLHANINGIKMLMTLFSPNQFRYDSRDWIAPCLASAVVSNTGGSIVLTFNEAKNPPLLGVNTQCGFTVKVNNVVQTLYRAQLTGPKEVTLWLSGKPIPAGSQVQVGFTPNSGNAITDNSPLHNSLLPFDNQPAWNNSVSMGTEAAPSIVASGVSATHNNGRLEVTVNFTNKGGCQASVVEMTSATLNNVATSTPMTLAVGDIACQGTKSATFSFPDLPSNTRAVLRLSGKHSQGSSSISVAVTVP